MTALTVESTVPARIRPTRTGDLDHARPADQHLRAAPPIAPTERARLRLLTAPAPDSATLPPATDWAGRLALGVFEVLAGTRPAAQLQRWLAPAVWDALVAAAATTVPLRRPRVRVLRVHDCALAPTVHEVAAVVHDGTRVRALGLRLEQHRDRWRATALELA